MTLRFGHPAPASNAGEREDHPPAMSTADTAPDVYADELDELVRELALIERPAWRAKLTELRASGVPLNAGDEDEGEAGGTETDDDGGTGDTGGTVDDDDDEVDGDLAAARKAATAANRELRRIKAEQAKAEQKAKADAGKWRDLYEETKAELEELKGKAELEAKERVAVAALAKAKARNPARAVKLLDLDAVDDEASAERAVKRLLKTDAYLFEQAPTRQKRGAGGRLEEDDEDAAGNGKRPVNRLRRGLETATRGG